MVFNSLSFLVFFTVFFFVYWFLGNRNLKLQNGLLLIGSYVFYAWAEWHFLLYLIGVSVLNYFLGIYIEKSASDKKKMLLLYIGLIQGIGGLAYFKYYNFFITSVKDALATINVSFGLTTLNIIIPLGISFFTFRTISYLLDIKNEKTTATKDGIVFFNYVAFFPSVLSGPIDKARTFIPQLENSRNFDFHLATDGLKQILWGLFKKLVVANNCATVVNSIFQNYDMLPATTLWIGMLLYSIQVYTDFSGYSDMAIGVSKLLGFQISKNFDFPFFAQSIPEYWRKWHISLTSWLTEYVFTPLSIQFRDYDKFGLVLSIVINFVICGIWHGANWTYVLFGLIHGLYFIPAIINGTMNKKKKAVKDRILPTFREVFNIVTTLIPVMLTFVLFKSDTVAQAFGYYGNMFSFTKSVAGSPVLIPFYVTFLILFCFILEWIGKNNEYAIKTFFPKSITLRGLLYFVLITAIFIFSAKEQQFIYFQF